MKIIYVAGGSYKSFYLNYFLKLKSCDLLIFNFGIFYNLKNNLKVDPAVEKELHMLANKLKCKIIAGVYAYNERKKKKMFLLCNDKGIYVMPANKILNINLDKERFYVSLPELLSCNANKIVLSEKRLYPNVKSCSKKKAYIFCDNFGVTVVKNKNLRRKFHKYSKIILK